MASTARRPTSSTRPRLQLPTGTTPPNLQITFTGAEFAISGSLAKIKLFNLISGSADFAVSVSTTNVAFSGLGKPDLTGATLITLASPT